MMEYQKIYSKMTQDLISGRRFQDAEKDAVRALMMNGWNRFEAQRALRTDYNAEVIYGYQNVA